MTPDVIALRAHLVAEVERAIDEALTLQDVARVKSANTRACIGRAYTPLSFDSQYSDDWAYEHARTATDAWLAADARLRALDGLIAPARATIDPMALLYDAPWMFPIGSFVVHRNGGHYRIASHAIEEASGTPVYVYSGFGGGESFVTWTRPRTEMEGGRFTVALAADVSDVPEDDPLRAEHAELIDAIADLADQRLEYNGELDSGCISGNARAIRLLARVGRVRLTGDGPGRNVSGVFVDREGSNG